jgi:hypothetical protein
MRGILRDLFKKIGLAVCILLFVILAGFFAITRGRADGADIPPPSPVLEEETASPPVSVESEEEPAEVSSGEETPPETPDGWQPPSPPRWFRSNAGGLALEAVPSRLAALRYQYALVIDYINPLELPETLSAFYQDSYEVEIRALYEKRQQTRKQWIFRDENGVVRLNAVFTAETEEPVLQGEGGGEQTSGNETLSAENEINHSTEEEAGAEQSADTENTVEETAAGETPEKPEAEKRRPSGFIEIFRGDSRLAEEYEFLRDSDEETKTDFFYQKDVLVKTESFLKKKHDGVEQNQKTHTDNYRYNRSGSLRSVERVYHTKADAPVRLSFPSRTLEAAANDSFFSNTADTAANAFGAAAVDEGYRLVFTTDARGRTLTQTLLDGEGNTVWSIENTWNGDRIASALKTEGDEKLLYEYEYDGEGNRIVERNYRNGILERLVRAEGGQEIEELYMDGLVILRAMWENGRKISEERIRKNMRM